MITMFRIYIICAICLFFTYFNVVSAQVLTPSRMDNNELVIRNGICFVNGKQHIYDELTEFYGGGPDWNGASSSNNVITIYDGDFSIVNVFFGGYATHEGNYANGNKIIVKNGVFKHHHLIAGGGSGVTLKNNVVSIEGGYLHNIYGASGGIEASYNSVNILGGKIGGVVDGLYGEKLEAFVYGAQSENTKYNQINIYNFPDLTEANLIGGRSDRDKSIGNMLNIYTKGVSVKSIWRFQNINLYLPENITSGEAVFTIVGEVVDLRDIEINVIIPDNANLHSGDKIYLINDYCKGLAEDSITIDNTTRINTISNKYRVSYSLDNNKQNIIATVL